VTIVVKLLIITINMTISARRVDMVCDDNATTTKRWAPFSPPDDFDVADATCPVSWVLATRRAGGGRREGELRE